MRLIVALLMIIFSSLSAFAEPKRIVSLAPSVTETLYYLKAFDKLVGVSNYCNWPEQTKEKVKVGGMVNPSYEIILSLKPDLVIISKEVTPKEVYEKLISLGLNVHVYAPTSLEDFFYEVKRLARVVGKEKEAEKLLKDFKEELKAIKRDFKGKKALFFIWPEPIVLAGEKSHISDVMKFLGIVNLSKSSSLNIEEIIKLNPDIIFIGYGHRARSEKLIVKLKDTDAVRRGNVFYISERIYRLSPKIIEGIKEMASVKIN
ncbi:helical backbone metal receptor [Thermodesulfovibrio sp.]|uniref:ABC transporter substrate-binding protein n=1 Tax=Thermodesulfovibrio sp. TaxID=2067987 RepID=UPI00309E73CD